MVEKDTHLVRVLASIQQENDNLGCILSYRFRVLVRDKFRCEYLGNWFYLFKEPGSQVLGEVLDDSECVDLVFKCISVH